MDKHKTTKNMLRKCHEEGRDPYIALLEYRTTPVTGMTLSPAQRLINRVLRTKLPCTEKLLQPTVPWAVHDQLVHRKARQKHYYDQGSKPLSTLYPGDTVRVCDNSKWEPAVVLRPHNSPQSSSAMIVSYAATGDICCQLWNRHHIVENSEEEISVQQTNMIVPSVAPEHGPSCVGAGAK